MEWMRVIEIALAITVIINCVSVIILLMVSKRGTPNANRLLCLLLLAIGIKLSYAFLPYNRHDWGAASFALFLLTRSAFILFGPLFFMYLRSLAKKSTNLATALLIVLPAFTPLFGYLLHFKIPIWSMQAYLLLFIFITFFDLKAFLWRGKKSNRNDTERLWMKTMFVSMVAIWMVVNLLLLNSKLYVVELLVIFTMLFYIDILLAVKYYWLKKGNVYEPGKYKNSNLTLEEENLILSRLKKVMTGEKLYLETDITLPKVAVLIGVKPHKLSQVINQKLNMTFNEYVNSYRIEDVKLALKSPANKDLKIAHIAFDYGFNSISVFNTAFKKFANDTPSQFRNECFINNQN